MFRPTPLSTITGDFLDASMAIKADSPRRGSESVLQATANKRTPNEPAGPYPRANCPQCASRTV